MFKHNVIPLDGSTLAERAIAYATQVAPRKNVESVQRSLRGAHRVLVTAVSSSAFHQGIGMFHKRGTMSLVGLPPGSFEMPIFDVVLNAKTVRGSIVGTRKDFQEALDFAVRGKVTAHYHTDKLEHINDVFKSMAGNAIDGRVVLSF